jgi:XapX domain-containing protein
MKLIVGLILAVCVGIACRWFGIPLPGPPAIMGAAMAVAMASGYTATDHWMTRKSTSTSSMQLPSGSSPIEDSELPTVRALHEIQKDSTTR